MRSIASLLLLLTIVTTACVFADSDRFYAKKESVPVFVNQVSPLDNPSETYEYYDLPFPCKPREESTKPESLGQVLEGDKFVVAPYDIRFSIPVEWKSLCGPTTLTAEEVNQFRRAIENYYTFSMIVDDLTVMGFVGTLEMEIQPDGSELPRHYLNTHLHFSIGVNQEQIVQVNLTSDPQQRVALTGDEGLSSFEFSYSVAWTDSDIPYSARQGHQNEGLLAAFSLYDNLSGPSDIRWFSILNSFLLIIFLTAFIAIILMRVLRRDYSRIEKQSDEDPEEADDEIGWKRIHTEVFRYPSNKALFCSLVGVGVQFLCLIFSLVFLVVMGVFSDYHRGALTTAAIVLYALTAAIGGYTSAVWYKRMGGESWLRNLVITLMLYAAPFWVVGAFLNSVAIGYHSTQALPATTIIIIITIWALVAFPLTFIGGMIGRRTAQPFNHPTITKIMAKPIPPQGWFQRLPVQLFVSGFLPFSAIYLELYYIFSSVWGHRLYTLYGVLFLAFIILIVVTACITICLVYFQLASEDYHWWWRSLLCGGGTSFFIFLYAIYFYVYQSQMNGFLQASFYFGNVLLASYAFFIMLGCVGYLAAHVFVHRIYSVVKTA